MQRKLIFLLAFMVLIAVFALQNSMEVQIKLWFWSVQTSMVLILILTFAAGAIAGLLFSLPKRKKESKQEEPGSTVQAANPPADQANDQAVSRDESTRDEDEFEDVGR